MSFVCFVVTLGDSEEALLRASAVRSPTNRFFYHEGHEEHEVSELNLSNPSCDSWCRYENSDSPQRHRVRRVRSNFTQKLSSLRPLRLRGKISEPFVSFVHFVVGYPNSIYRRDTEFAESEYFLIKKSLTPRAPRLRGEMFEFVFLLNRGGLGFEPRRPKMLRGGPCEGHAGIEIEEHIQRENEQRQRQVPLLR